ncbi:hypothetical protein ZIOFF_040041 [Zingiber officinale]|uniref:GH16 domain-containing protein n=1 Tax=Zingiber officinale TaxID=94328 RepID=A0A8J5KXM8_ZINOF|nr:hypothetical protein ZIOFF_040041 [Zingiber officinale]
MYSCTPFATAHHSPTRVRFVVGSQAITGSEDAPYIAATTMTVSAMPRFFCMASPIQFNILFFFFFFFFFYCVNAQPPSPGYYLSSKVRSWRFYQAYSTLWGAEHQSISHDQSSVTLWLDSNSGSGFKSNRPYRNGYFGASIKLQSGYTAGVNTAFYLSNDQAHPGHHDEVDIEFLGTTPGKPYTLQTNVYVRGSGDGRIIGREMRFHLWFDPTTDFHHYAILWNPDEIVFFVDDVPIRRGVLGLRIAIVPTNRLFTDGLGSKPTAIRGNAMGSKESPGLLLLRGLQSRSYSHSRVLKHSGCIIQTFKALEVS